MSYLSQPNLTSSENLLHNLGFIDTNNSFDITITTGGILTGEWFSCDNYASFNYIINASQNGDLDIEASMDGKTVDITKTINNVGGTPISGSVRIISPFIRFVYTNTSGSNSDVRLSVVHHFIRDGDNF